VRDEALVGSKIAAKYTLRRLIGRGGMGAVYEAENEAIGKRVAIKIVDEEWAKDESVVHRFAREARVASSVESEHIVTVFDAGMEGRRPYLVMELLRGEDMGTRLRRDRRVPLDEAIHVVAQVLRGLARAHQAGIVHRDLKPDNVYVTDWGADPLFAKILDFGISKIQRSKGGTAMLNLTKRGVVLGTPFYMAPEQAQASGDVDARADIYGVGAILFECLSGRPPHTGETYDEVILSIRTREVPDVRAFDADVPDEVAALLRRALARDKDERFASAEEMLAALHVLAPSDPATRPLPAPRDTGPVVVRGPSTDVSWGGATVAAEQPARMSRATILLTATTALIAGMGITLWIVAMTRAEPAPKGVSSASPHASAVIDAGVPAPRAPAVPRVASAEPPPVDPPKTPAPPATTAAPRGVGRAPAPPATQAPATAQPPAQPQPPATVTTAKKPDLDISREVP
jgi:tRNA A-37 threonylcarbamoyl transferase component Bud32